MWLPLFPLHTALFPGDALPLRVFEPRYREMMGWVLAGDRRFGVVAISAGTEVGEPSEVHSIGCIALIEHIAEAADGTFDLLCRGESRFQIVERLADDPYPHAEVRMLPDEPGENAAHAVAAARAALAKYARAVERLGLVIGHDEHANPIAESYRIAGALLVDVPVRQRLLACGTAAERLQLAGAVARREANILLTIGPSAGVPLGRPSPN
ncbi:MAG: LON peptidase substrate-binding domain-containing protein [Actinomycetota bacterium]|nr:LON peptidase substrate-binding domain-containing protein [Actinomycetota bacterium]